MKSEELRLGSSSQKRSLGMCITGERI
ncbi:MAG: hypothetical protein ACJAVP_003730, partial [Spirosomataceae bacterium]